MEVVLPVRLGGLSRCFAPPDLILISFIVVPTQVVPNRAAVTALERQALAGIAQWRRRKP